MPAILAEVSCLSNEQEAALLAEPLYRQYIAEALRGRLRSYCGRRRRQAGDIRTARKESETHDREERDSLHVGIDLGTSRSSISASNGQRHVVESYVGWPLDMVARKVLKKPVLIGREALDNRSMLDLHRPLEQGLIKEGSEKDEAAVRELLRHLLSLAGVSRGGRDNVKRPRRRRRPRRGAAGQQAAAAQGHAGDWSTA